MDQAAARGLNRDPQSKTVTKCKGKDCASSEHRIFRETRDGKFFQSSKEAARDKELSWGARGLHSYLQSLHQHSKITVKRLIELHGAGREATRGYLRELLTLGYVNQKCFRIGRGQFDYEITVYGSPDQNREFHKNNRGRKPVDGENTGDGNPSTAQPDTVEPSAVLPATENRIPETRPVRDLKIDDQEINTAGDQGSALGGPIDSNQSKESTHTQSAAAAGESIQAIAIEPRVCVPILNFDLDEIRRQYAAAHQTTFHPVRRKGIDNIKAWLYTAKDGRYDELVIPWWREQQELAEQRLTIRARLEAERLKHEQDVEEHRQELAAKAAAEWEQFRKEKAEEWERNAPQRERERLEQIERTRREVIEECKRLTRQARSANNPKIYTDMIETTLSAKGDAQARAEFEEWRTNQEKAQAATAA